MPYVKSTLAVGFALLLAAKPHYARADNGTQGIADALNQISQAIEDNENSYDGYRYKVIATVNENVRMPDGRVSVRRTNREYKGFVFGLDKSQAVKDVQGAVMQKTLAQGVSVCQGPGGPIITINSLRKARSEQAERQFVRQEIARGAKIAATILSGDDDR